jgi:hypothetical protein
MVEGRCAKRARRDLRLAYPMSDKARPSLRGMQQKIYTSMARADRDYALW